MGFNRLITWIIIVTMALGLLSCSKEKVNVLVFSKTDGFRHESIEAGQEALRKMAEEKGFTVSFTEDGADFNTDNLKQYHAVLFLNTTGDVLNDEQEEAFERYIQAGGGYVGVHAASDTEYDWGWYGQLAGAYFLDHPADPNVQTGTFVVEQKDHWATRGMPDTFEKTDEFYSFYNISPHINVVLSVDESTYTGGSNGDNHPMSWYREFDGGRSFYTAMGHTSETFSEELFLNHLWAGINYAAGGDKPVKLDYSKARPEENRFTKVVLAEKLNEPMELALLDEDRILFIQRNGEVRLYKNSTQELTTIANIPVSTKYVNDEGEESTAEDGLLGLAKDPNFAENNWVYMYFSIPEEPKNVLARFEMDGDELVLESRKIILEVDVQRKECCHAAGSITFDDDGNLYLSTGDNTNPHASRGYSPSDERPGRSPWDAQKSSANTNDLRGKILRITPQPDGSYTIPEGNLFPEGTANTRPEIYTMGHRNPFRIAVDSRTGYLYWGDVGPDANDPDATRGPAGHDEVGQARGPGNFGWPHFVGDNKAYTKYDFAAEKSLEPWNPEAPINTSPNNTGLTELPPAQKAFIWYPYGESSDFPMVGSGGRNAMAGPVYYVEDFAGAEHAWPKYYDKKLIAYEWMRGWIMAVDMDEEGNYIWMDRIMPSYQFSNPTDMVFAENGDLYLLEYGTGWFTQNDNARLVRIEYNGGNRKPKVQVATDSRGGTLPLSVNLSAAGTTDPDGDKLTYSWEVTSDNGYRHKGNSEALSLTFEEAGVYTAKLTVDDGAGETSTQSLEIVAGNAAPELSLALTQGNRTFFNPNAPLAYEVSVRDVEDGSLGSGITPDRVAVNFDYLPDGYDQIKIAQGHRSADAETYYAKGKNLIEGSDCMACHKIKGTSIGPSYIEVAQKYQNDEDALDYLSDKIIGGGAGVWGEVAMAGHPDLPKSDAEDMVKYILSLANDNEKIGLPPSGSHTMELPEGDPGKGVYLVRAAYEDNGASGLPSLRSEEVLVLKSASVNAHSLDVYDKARKMSFGGNDLVLIEENGAYMAMEQVDLTNVTSMVLAVTAPVARLNAAGGKVELRLGSPDGTLIGTSRFLEAADQAGFAPRMLPVPVTLPDGYAGELQDLYLVFVNEETSGQTLMVFLGAQVVLGSGAD